ncbi:hypothetical protein QFC21_006895 [Naganishia friedmannii]|uniref:Uncharacterized protein n=1 Tax=Naganishia friedmannii TaxID=89922 RepID=A0ACC2UZ95_9TREE|nr:hypothetical protein QFC21_006895 [Naganishia friedmannii]
MSYPTPNLTSPSSDSLLLSPSTNTTTARYTTDNILLTRGRSRAQPIHLVRQALGVPHFGIAKGVVAPPSSRGRKAKEKVLVGGTSTPVMNQEVRRYGLPQLDGDKASGRANEVKKVLKPIMSRLPLSPSTITTIDDTSETRRSDSLYIELVEEADVFYTQARLPYLSEQDTQLWKSLHQFRPTRNDYGAAFKEVAGQVASTTNESRLVHPGLDVARLLREQDTTDMRPITKCPGFAKQASAYVSLIRQAFNWALLPPLPLHLAGKYYGVLFRSTRHSQHIASSTPSSLVGEKKSNASSSLYAADREAHEEAVQSGGLLMYWYGEPDAQGNNVATCIWTGRDAARRASRLEKHKLAAGLAGQVYESYELVRYCVRKIEGETGVRIEAWDE